MIQSTFYTYATLYIYVCVYVYITCQGVSVSSKVE